jgi:hypothetical protein
MSNKDMKFIAGYIGIFGSSTLIGLIGVADKIPEAGALVVLSGVLIYILKAHREDRKEFLAEIKELRKELAKHRENHND